MTKERAVKYSQHKPRWSLIPWLSMEQVVRVMEAGLHEGTDKEREKNDWQKGTNWTEYSDAAMRHLVAWQQRETYDKESGKSHLAHVVCCCLILIWYELKGVGRDDR